MICFDFAGRCCSSLLRTQGGANELISNRNLYPRALTTGGSWLVLVLQCRGVLSNVGLQFSCNVLFNCSNTGRCVNRGKPVGKHR